MFAFAFPYQGPCDGSLLDAMFTFLKGLQRGHCTTEQFGGPDPQDAAGAIDLMCWGQRVWPDSSKWAP